MCTPLVRSDRNTPRITPLAPLWVDPRTHIKAHHSGGRCRIRGRVGESEFELYGSQFAEFRVKRTACSRSAGPSASDVALDFWTLQHSGCIANPNEKALVTLRRLGVHG